jgi:copper(I)-binding protein
MRRFHHGGLALAMLVAASAHAAGRLEVGKAWIRLAPPGATMLAGYATLRNIGDAPLAVVAADSEDFGDVSLHRSVESNGVSRMEPVTKLELTPGKSQVLEPGGYHLMLMRARRELKAGDVVKIHLATEKGPGLEALFVVRESAP